MMKRNSWISMLQQILIWGFGWLAILLILNSGEELDHRFWTRTLSIIIGSSLVVFVNLNWLLPKFYFKNKRGAYYLFVVALLLFTVWCIHSDLLPWNWEELNSGDQVETNRSSDQRNNEGSTFMGNYVWLLRNLPPLFISLLGSSLIALSGFAREKVKKTAILEKAKLQAEIKFLKSQINPHFLFNSLHNIYALTVIQSELAPEHLLKLSDILRYMLYDSNEMFVPLQREVVYLENYLSLAQLKDSRGMDVTFTQKTPDLSIQVAPLLFIPFVENAFKHSQIEDLDEGFIHISLLAVNGQLVFEIENSKPKRESKKDEVGGIGLNNVEQRLQLLYPSKHVLRIEDSREKFKVHLSIQYL